MLIFMAFTKAQVSYPYIIADDVLRKNGSPMPFQSHSDASAMRSTAALYTRTRLPLAQDTTTTMKNTPSDMRLQVICNRNLFRYRNDLRGFLQWLPSVRFFEPLRLRGRVDFEEIALLAWLMIMKSGAMNNHNL